MKLRKITLPLLMAFILSCVFTITASAAKLGDAYSWEGIQIGYVLMVAAIVCVVILYYALKIKPFKKAAPLFAIIFAAGLILALTDVAVEVEPAEITPDVDWSVTASEVQGGNITINNEDDAILIMCHVNSTAGTILDVDDTAFTQPIFNFTVAPTVTEGLTDLQLGATTLAIMTNPDQAFTVSGTSYDLFSDVSGTSGEKDVAWLADGTTEYESHYCTVQFGTSEVIRLTLTYNPAGISQLVAGTVKTSTVTVGGESYTISLLITGVLT